MQVNVQALNQAASELAAFVERRVRFAMRRRAVAVPQVTVRLDALSATRGGPLKECRIALRTAGHGTLVARALATTWRRAVREALSRAVQLLGRVLGRRATRRAALPQPGDAA